jgi:hypothetical protein
MSSKPTKSELSAPVSVAGASAPVPLFTAPELAEIRRALTEEFGERLFGGESFDVTGELRGDEVIVKATIATADRSRVATLETSLLIDIEKGDNVSEARAAAVEFIQAWVHDWLRTDREERPHLDWKDYDWGGRSIRFRGSDVAQKLVDMADELLRKAGFEGDT